MACIVARVDELVDVKSSRLLCTDLVLLVELVSGREKTSNVLGHFHVLLQKKRTRKVKDFRKGGVQKGGNEPPRLSVTHQVKSDGVVSAGDLHRNGRLVVCDGADVLPPAETRVRAHTRKG